VDIATNPNQVYTEFKDKNGNIVRSLTAGKGNTLTFTNLVTGEKLVVRSNGSVTHVALGADFDTWSITGHNVLILFPTDVPAGPMTTLYVGRVVFTVDKTTGVFTLQSTSGHATDICASLWSTFKSTSSAAAEIGAEALEDEAVRRGHEGWGEPVFYQGQCVATVRKYSDTLLIFLLKGRKPQRYRERVEHSGKLSLEQIIAASRQGDEA